MAEKPMGIHIAGAAPLLDLNHAADSTSRAVEAVGLRTERGQMEPIEPPFLVATDGSTAPRGLHFHQKTDTTQDRLTASAAALLVNGAAALLYDGSAFTLPGTGVVRFAQSGPRTFFIALPS